MGWSSKYCYSLLLGFSSALVRRRKGPLSARCRMQNVGVLDDEYCWWTKSCTTKDDDYPIIYRVLTIPGGAGFCPSTVTADHPNKKGAYACFSPFNTQQEKARVVFKFRVITSLQVTTPLKQQVAWFRDPINSCRWYLPVGSSLTAGIVKWWQRYGRRGRRRCAISTGWVLTHLEHDPMTLGSG